MALPAVADGGTVRGPPVKVGEPFESAVPIRVAFPDWTKSMTMQLGLSAAHAWKLFSVIVNWLPGGPELGFTLMLAAPWASAGGTKSASAQATRTRTAPRRAGSSVRITGGGYVLAEAACYRSSSATAACPLGQKARKSHRLHQDPGVVGKRPSVRPSSARPRRERTSPRRAGSQSTASISA